MDHNRKNLEFNRSNKIMKSECSNQGSENSSSQIDVYECLSHQNKRTKYSAFTNDAQMLNNSVRDKTYSRNGKGSTDKIQSSLKQNIQKFQLPSHDGHKLVNNNHKESLNAINKLKVPIYKNIVKTAMQSSSSQQKQMNASSINLKVLKGDDLMCWEPDSKKIRPNEKYEVAYKNMITKYSLIALFKCMGKKCSYATDNPGEILNHFYIHDKDVTKKKERIYKKFEEDLKNAINDEATNEIKSKRFDHLKTIQDYFLCCSYCQFRAKDYKMLVHHINDIHRKDIYQCGYCFFRSCVKQICVQHMEISHKNKPILIYECLGKNAYEIAKEKASERLSIKRQKHVAVLRCKLCNVGFYPLKEFLEHCEKDHRTEKEIKEIEQHLHILDKTFKFRGYGLFQCLYCVHGSHSQGQMLSHLVEHPSEFGFYCIRESKEEIRDPYFYTLIDSTTIVDVNNNDVKTQKFNENPELLCNKNLKEIFDKDLLKMFQINKYLN